MATYFTFTTADNKQVNVYVFGKNYAAHVCRWGGNDPFTIEGRDTYEVLKSDGKNMTWNEIINMFK